MLIIHDCGGAAKSRVVGLRTHALSYSPSRRAVRTNNGATLNDNAKKRISHFTSTFCINVRHGISLQVARMRFLGGLQM